MPEKNGVIWADKSAYFPIILCSAIAIGMGLAIALNASYDLFGRLVFGTIVPALIVFWFALSPYMRPLKITKNGLIMSQKKLSIKRKLIPFDEIHSLKTQYGLKETLLEFLVCEDNNGKKYENVIYAVSEFKEILKQLGQKKEIQDSGWYKILPKQLR